jgi:hypothetical protein
MLVEVTNNNETNTRYAFDPEHFDGVCKFYDEAVESGQIISWRIVS